MLPRMTARLGGALRDFLAESVGEHGANEKVSEYARDLVCRDKQRPENEAFDRLKVELAQAFVAPDSSYTSSSAAEVMARNRT